MVAAEHATRIIRLLGDLYRDAECELDHRNPWQLLVATVLSAQCTDVRVNMVTPALFERWPTPRALAEADQTDVEQVIRSTGFFRVKAQSLREAARIVVADHGGDVPRNLIDLVTLPGVGRKTAKVVLGEAFGIAAGVAVDAHVNRLSQRLGLTRQKDSERISTELEALIPQEEWIGFSLRLVLHGRRVCSARAPQCKTCGLNPVCPRVGV